MNRKPIFATAFYFNLYGTIIQLNFDEKDLDPNNSTFQLIDRRAGWYQTMTMCESVFDFKGNIFKNRHPTTEYIEEFLNSGRKSHYQFDKLSDVSEKAKEICTIYANSMELKRRKEKYWEMEDRAMIKKSILDFVDLEAFRPVVIDYPNRINPENPHDLNMGEEIYGLLRTVLEPKYHNILNEAFKKNKVDK